jgi:hypothetical protein
MCPGSLSPPRTHSTQSFAVAACPDVASHTRGWWRQTAAAAAGGAGVGGGGAAAPLMPGANIPASIIAPQVGLHSNAGLFDVACWSQLGFGGVVPGTAAALMPQYFVTRTGATYVNLSQPSGPPGVAAAAAAAQGALVRRRRRRGGQRAAGAAAADPHAGGTPSMPSRRGDINDTMGMTG